MPFASGAKILVLGLSLMALKAEPRPAGCAKQLARAPSSERTQQCYLKAAAKTKSPEILVEELSKFLDSHPDTPELWNTLATISEGHDMERALVAWEQAGHIFTRRNQRLSAARAYTTRFHRLPDKRRTKAELQRLYALLSSTQPLDSASAMVLSVATGNQLRSAAPLHERAFELQELSPAVLEGYPADVAVEVHHVRLWMTRESQDFNLAKDELSALTQRAQETKNPRHARLAHSETIYLSYLQAHVSPSQSNVEEARRVAFAACSPDGKTISATQSYTCNIWAELSHPPDPETASLLESFLDQCAQVSKEATHRAECLRLRSRALTHSSPDRSMQDALAAVQTMAKSDTDTDAKLSVWEQLMRSFWAHRSLPEARALSRATLMEIEFMRQAQSTRGMRLGSFASWITNYQWLANQLLLAPEPDKSTLSEAFFIQERSRARALWEQMRKADPPPASKRQILELRKSLQGELIEWSKDIVSDSTQNNQARMAKIDALTQNLQSTAYPHWSFATLESIQALLRPDQAMVSYQVAVSHSHDGEEIGGTWATIITKDKVTPLHLTADRLMLSRAIQSYSRAVRESNTSLERVQRKLHSWIMEPIQKALPASVRNLIIVPDGSLYSLPFFALAPEYAFSFTPSATIWASLQSSRKAPYEPQSVALVDPARSAQHPDPESEWNLRKKSRTIAASIAQPLPASRNEPLAIEALLGGPVRTLQGEQATKENLKAALQSKHNLLHISAHSFIGQGTHAPSSIALANAQREDFGLLQSDEIRDFNLNENLVILGGCETGWGNAIAGEGMLSLARAFQEAGARAVLASLWPLRDDHTAVFFQRFYARLGQGLALDEALAQTQRSLKDDGFPAESYAPFVILGDGSTAFVANPNAPRQGVSKRVWVGSLTTVILLIAGALLFRERRRRRG